MPNGRDLNSKCIIIRKILLVFYLPICLSMLFCAMYSTYLTVETWNCRSSDDKEEENTPNRVKCYTILDTLSGRLSKYIPERKILMVLRTGSLMNTLFTYVSAWIATYKLTLLPLLWLAIVSIASFFITLNISIIFGPLTGINNFELVPILIGIKLHPFLITGIVLAIDLIIAIMAISLVINSYKKRV